MRSTIKCYSCEQEIYEGEYEYVIDDHAYCPDCFRTYIREEYLSHDLFLPDLAEALGIPYYPVGG